MASMYEVRTADEIDAIEACVRDAASRTAAHLRELPEDGLALLRRLLEPIGNIPPAEAEERCYAQLEETALAA